MINLKLISISLITIFLLSSCIFEKEPDVLWIYINEKTHIENNPITTNKEQSRINLADSDKNKDVTKIKSYLRTFCWVYKNVDSLVTSNHFYKLKTIVDRIDSKESKFIYIEMPSYVFEMCKNKSPEYIETLTLYLQTSLDDLNWLNLKLKTWYLTNYIEELNLVNEDVPSNIKEATSFNNYFLDKNTATLEAFYYPYYLKEKNNIKSFLSKPIFSLEKDNKNKELALRNLIKNLDDLWIESIDEFRLLLLKNNNFKDENELKESIKKDYLNIISNNKILSEKLIDLSVFKGYINSRAYQKLLDNNNFKNNITEFWKKMLILSIVWNDYADGLNETWAWKQFFWDEKIGNWIIRLNYIYILSL